MTSSSFGVNFKHGSLVLDKELIFKGISKN